ncbi:DUF6478 family protein [Roseobacter sp. A03A-229]
MGKSGDTFWDTAIYRRALHRWALSARDAKTAKLSLLRRQRTRARMLRAHLDRLIHTADERLALPVVGSNSFPKPHNADWSWRPELWRGPLATPGQAGIRNQAKVGDEITVFHDCDRSELTLRQVRNARQEDLAPYGLRVDVFRFDGSFLSVVLDLPDPAIDGLKRTHILQLSTLIDMEKPIEIFARLNIRHGPNTEQMVREFDLRDASVTVDFDLAYSNLNEQRVERAWIDLIFEGPDMNLVTLRDLTFSRRQRAQI